MSGFIAGFDHDDYAAIVNMADELMKIGIDVPFLSIMTPFKGTSLYEQLKQEDRMLDERGWNFYNGYNVAFQPKNLTPLTLLQAHRELWKRSFSFKNSLIRIIRGLRLRRGAFLLTFFMNSFYCLKKLRGNYPIDMSKRAAIQVPPLTKIEPVMAAEQAPTV